MDANRACFMTVLVLAASLAALAAAPPPAPQDSSQPPSVSETLFLLQQKLDSERYAEGLALSERALTLWPKHPDVLYAQALCLVGLHRTKEAAAKLEALAEKHPDRIEFRFKQADCLLSTGDVAEALQLWAAFFSDPGWGEVAYSHSVKALLASGREDEARALVDEGQRKLGRASEDLLRYGLDLERDGRKGLAILERLKLFDPQDQKGYGALSKLYAAVGDGALYVEEAPAPGTVIPLENVTDPREGSTLGLAGGDAFFIREPAAPVLSVPVSIGGARPEWMMLDSGSPLVFLSPLLADRLGLKPIATAHYGGMGREGVQESQWVLVPELKVGPVAFRNVPAVLVSRKSDFWSVTPGIIPLSLLRRHAVVYDPAAPSLTLFPSGTPAAEALGYNAFPVKSLWPKGCPFMQVKIQGRDGLLGLADTGSFSTLIAQGLSPVLAVQSTVPQFMIPYRSGLSGTFSFALTRDVKFCFGRECTRLTTVQVTPIGLQYGIPCAAIMGRNILDRFQILFDYRQNALYFKPRER